MNPPDQPPAPDSPQALPPQSPAPGYGPPAYGPPGYGPPAPPMFGPPPPFGGPTSGSGQNQPADLLSSPWAVAGNPAARPAGRGQLFLLAGVLPVVLLLVVGAVAGAIYLAGGSAGSTITTTSAKAGPTPSPTLAREPTTDDCATQDSGHYVLAPCGPAAMKVLVAAVADADPAEVCPDPTDLFGYTASSDILCLQRPSGAHEGDPGKGGGVLRPGDCLGNVIADGFAEVACASPKAFHRLTALATDPGKCPNGSVRAMERPTNAGVKKIACAVDAAGIAGPGECVSWPAGEKAPTDVPVPCSGSGPTGKLMGRKATEGGCARFHSASGRYYVVERPDNLPVVKFNCYIRLR
ncbi:MAG: hypothetical protein QOD41_4656 [Cryptosporangiaceae bacterium]|nr:hypothetical protein [Cryptosporangiaceae bacterium]